MRKLLLATVASLCLVSIPPAAKAQFAVIDVANLQQNLQQTLQQVVELIRLLTQIELLIQQVTGTDFTVTGELNAALGDVQRVLGEGTAILFQEAQSLEQFRDLYPEVFEAIETLEGLTTLVRGQTQQLLDASRQAVQTQSLSAEAIDGILTNVETSLAQSQAAVGQTQAVQVGNQLAGQIAAILTQIQGSQLASQRVQALELAQQASREQAASEFSRRFNNADAFANSRTTGVIPEGWPQ